MHNINPITSCMISHHIVPSAISAVCAVIMIIIQYFAKVNGISEIPKESSVIILLIQFEFCQKNDFTMACMAMTLDE